MADTTQSITTPKRVQTDSNRGTGTSDEYLLFKFNDNGQGASKNASDTVTAAVAGKPALKEKDCRGELGFHFSSWKKWGILWVIFFVQCSMNYNASVYGNAVPGMMEHFKIKESKAIWGQAFFLLTYAFGCELWAPFSEEYGRWSMLQLSLLFVNIWQIPCALAPNYTTIYICRALGGLSSAGGSVTLGMVADMWRADDQQYAVAFVVFSSVLGSAIGPIVGGFLETYFSWRAIFWSQLIAGALVQAMHFFLVPETRTTVMMDKIAKRRRTNGEEVYGPSEQSDNSSLTLAKAFTLWKRPFVMFATEPIVSCLSLLSGFSDALIFTFLAGFGFVFKQWGFNAWQLGLTFVPIVIGYILGYVMFLPFISRDMQKRARQPGSVEPESRLKLLLWLAPLETIGLFIFAWTSLGPTYGIPWIAPMIAAILIGIANYAIYMATVDYMIASYGEYSASATGGNGFARDLLAGIAAFYSAPMFRNIPGKLGYEWASTILGVLALVILVPVYIIYWKGPQIRNNSKFAMQLAKEDEKAKDVVHHREMSVV